MNLRRPAALAAALLFLASGAFALDFGGSLSASPKYESEDYSAKFTAAPWASGLIGDKADFYLSAKAVFDSADSDDPFRFDLGRTQLTLRPLTWVKAEAGRLSYTDSTGLVATGLFDGVRVLYLYSFGTVSVAGYYTGLLNKKEAEIYLSPSDLADFADDGVYFAPKRAFGAVALKLPGALETTVEVLGQMDLGDGPALNSQYASLKIAVPLGSSAEASVSGVGSFSEYDSGAADYSAAGTFDLSWTPPTAAADKLYFSVRWESAEGNGLSGFIPIKNVAAGNAYAPYLPGVAALKGGYFVRPLKSLSFDLSGTAFLKQGDGPIDSDLASGASGRYLGSEAFLSATFAPSQEIFLVAGGGAFFPDAGGTYASGTGARVKCTATAVVSF